MINKSTIFSLVPIFLVAGAGTLFALFMLKEQGGQSNAPSIAAVSHQKGHHERSNRMNSTESRLVQTTKGTTPEKPAEVGRADAGAINDLLVFYESALQSQSSAAREATIKMLRGLPGEPVIQAISERVRNSGDPKKIRELLKLANDLQALDPDTKK